MKSYCYVALLLLVCASVAAAQSPAKILKQAEKAMGGGNAVQKITSAERVGIIKRLSDGATGKF